MTERPILLTGVYRSGTTLLAQVLNAHSRLRVACDRVQYLRYYLKRFNPPEEKYREIVHDASVRLSERFSDEVPEKQIVDELAGCDDVRHRDVYQTMMRATYCPDQPSLRWGEKTVLEWSNIPLFLEMFPQGQAIHIIRDPRDVTASYREFTIEPADRYLDATFACLHSMNWAASYGPALPDEHYVVVRHEDMVSSPDGFTRDLCRFLGVDFEPAMLDAASFQDQNGNAWQPNTAFGDIKRGHISTKSINRWTEKLEDFEVVFVESIIGDLLGRFGYARSGLRPDIPTITEMWRRFRNTPLLQERLHRWLRTGEGIETYPSNPLDPANWAKGMGPKGAKLDGPEIEE